MGLKSRIESLEASSHNGAGADDAYIIVRRSCDSPEGSHYDTLSSLRAQVNKEIARGYVPCGGLVADTYSREYEGGTIFMQAMVKKEVL